MISREEGRGGRREGKERGMQAGVRCYYTAVASHRPPQLPSKLHLSRSLALSSTHTHTHKPTPTPQILRDSRYASQCPPRHRTHSLQYARSHQPVSNREYGCITNATARLCGTGGPAQVRSRNNEGNFQNRNREYKKKKKNSFTLTQSSSITPILL